jgi:WD40 repeat protein
LEPSTHEFGENLEQFRAYLRLLALATSDGTLSLWDVAGSTEILRWSAQVGELAFTPDGSFLTTTSAGLNPQEGYSSLQLLDLAHIRRHLAGMGLSW